MPAHDEAREKPPEEIRDLRRADFVEATLACLAEHGYQGTTVRRIAAKAGVAPGLLTHYFIGKDALVAAAYRALGERLARHLDERVEAVGSDPVERLAAFVSASFRPPNIDPAVLRIWVNFWTLVVNEPAIRKIHAETYADYRARVAGLIAPVLAARGRSLSPRELEAIAIGLTALLDGLWLELCLDQSVFDAAEGERIAHGMIGSLLGIDFA